MSDWCASQIELWPLDKLVPYARNARTHTEAQVAQIAASIREFGFTNPILANSDGSIVAGHGRLQAARQLGLEVVPVITLDHLTATQRKALTLADNRLAELAGWNNDMLALELTELKMDDFDMDLTGFDTASIDALLAEQGNEGQTDPDAVPEVQAKAVSELGDVWQLGRHRIICGDCTDGLVVAKVLGDVRPHLMVTDPPYGVEYDPTRRSANAAKSGVVLNDDRADWYDAWALFPGEVAYVWHASLHTATVLTSLERSDFEIRAQIIWAKNQFSISRGHYHPQHEPCWYAVRKGTSGHWGGDRTQSTVWNVDKNRKSETGHSTQKPVECMRRPIENNSSPGQVIYEPFCGSGTTIIAGEQSGRAVYAIELSPLYVDVGVRRWQEFTGKNATREADGVSFNEAAAAVAAGT